MFTNPRRVCIFPAVCGLVLACILLSPMAASPVWADVGVQPILPGGSNIQPEGQTPIQMVAEKVVLNVRKATEADNAAVKLNPDAYALKYSMYAPAWYPAVAEVAADFTMANPTGEVESMMAWFPLASALETVEWNLNPDEIVPRIESFQVAVEGEPLVFNVSELPNPKGQDKPPLPWASFPVTFPAGKETHIHVSYVLPAYQTLDFIGMRLYYIFQTGAGWAGPIGKAELVVNLPYPASAETIGAAPKGGQAGGQQVRWTWKNLEPGPQDDFSIWLLLPQRWDELQAARAEVKENPEDGLAWLNLAGTYSLLARGLRRGQILPGFGETYQPLGVQACQQAARLLPDNAGPHFGLAVLYLAALPENPSPKALQPALDELKRGKVLEAVNPQWDVFDSSNVDDMLELIYTNATATAEETARYPENATRTAIATIYYDATATAEAVNWARWATAEANCDDATATAGAATSVAGAVWEATQTPSLTATQLPIPTRTLTPSPSTTLELAQTALAMVAPPTPTLSQPGNGGSQGQSLILVLAAGVAVLVIVGYLARKRK